jgi:hypothetical protein
MVLRTYSCRWGAMANLGEGEFEGLRTDLVRLGPDKTGGGPAKTRTTAVS